MYENLSQKQTNKETRNNLKPKHKQAKKFHSNLMYFNLPRNFRGLPNNLNAYIF